MVYKTPTIVSTDLFDLEKIGALEHVAICGPGAAGT